MREKVKKTTFTKSEFTYLKTLVSKKVLEGKIGQQKIRSKMRKMGFYISYFTSKKGFNVSDLDNLVSSGEIKIQEPS